jgi:hypothetical protein
MLLTTAKRLNGPFLHQISSQHSHHTYQVTSLNSVQSPPVRASPPRQPLASFWLSLIICHHRVSELFPISPKVSPCTASERPWINYFNHETCWYNMVRFHISHIVCTPHNLVCHWISWGRLCLHLNIAFLEIANINDHYLPFIWHGKKGGLHKEEESKRKGSERGKWLPQ